MTAPGRLRSVEALRTRTFDVLVVGGGIVGCGIARDLALRGLSVALLEQHDFAWGTTSRPTRLIHGGLRYLETLDLELVWTDLREREVLLRLAPHLVFPLRFLLPHHDASVLYRSKLRAGMALYDLLSLRKSLPGRSWLTRDQVLAAEPTIRADGLQGAWSFYDAQVPFVERLVVENALDAEAAGAVVLNHARVERFDRDATGRVTGAGVRDLIAREDVSVRARLTVNATGPWLDITQREILKGKPRALRLTKGVHIVTPGGTRNAIVEFAQSDGRLFFVTPWLGCSLIGTTDTDYTGDPGEAAATDEDIRYLQSEAQRAFPSAPFGEIHYASAGIRALVRVDDVPEGEVSRKHAVVDHERRDRIAGLISVVGGKITAYRAIAQEVADLASAKLGRRRGSVTGVRPLPGGRAPRGRAWIDEELWPRARCLGLERAQADHLVAVYGSLAHEVLDLVDRDRSLREPVCPHHPAIVAELLRSAESEWAVSLADTLLRRTPLGLMPDQVVDCADRIADRMGELVGWDATDRTEQVAAYRAEIAPMRRAASRFTHGSSGVAQAAPSARKLTPKEGEQHARAT